MRRAALVLALASLLCGELVSAQLSLGSGQPPHPAGVSGLACGPNASVEGTAVTVVPSGGDDSATLQCVLDGVRALGVRHIRLAAGSFHAVSLVATAFHGRLSGAGEDRTVIENPPGQAYVTPVDFLSAPPGPDNPWPSFVAFVDGDFVVSDLSLKATGVPTTGWSLNGMGPIHALAHGFVIVGSEAHASFERVAIAAEAMPPELNAGMWGTTIFNGIYFEGVVAAGLPLFTPLKGSFAVRNSIFLNMADGTPSSNLSDAKVMILGNTFSGIGAASDTDDLVNSTYLFANNRVVDAQWYGFMHYDYCLGAAANCGTTGSTISIVGNDFGSSVEGVLIDGTLGAENGCLVAGNKAAGVADMAVFLGPGTAGCQVVSDGSVVDLGTGNRVVRQ